MSRLIISYAKNGREAYEDAILRAKNAVKETNPNLEICILIDDLPKGVPKHTETPYAFKPFLFKKAFEQGYKQVIWIDSTIVTVKDLQPMFDYMAQHGVLSFHNLGHPLKNWISDVACENLKLTENELENVEQIMACVVGFDITTKTGKKVFEKWYKEAKKGESFKNNTSKRKGFIAHRHDQAVLSVFLHQHNLPMLPYGYLVYEPHDETKEYGDNFYFVNKRI